MVAPVVACGASPVFYGLNEQGQPQLGAPGLAGAKALIAAHLFGVPVDMRGVREWCDQQGVFFIEDCAHCLFGEAPGGPVGRLGDAAIGSLTKFMAVSEGGCLWLRPGLPPPALRTGAWAVSAKAAFDMLELGAQHQRLPGLNAAVNTGLRALRLLRPARRPTRAAKPSAADPSPWASGTELTMDLERAKRRMALPCRWLARRTPRQASAQARQQAYHVLWHGLQGHPGLRPLRPDCGLGDAPYALPLWVDQPDPGYAEVRRLGLPVMRWDRVWPGSPVLLGDVAPAWRHHVLQVLCHQDLRPAQLQHITTALLGIFGSPRSGA
jgi:perosamine synthetase